jgi:hypothetical protein
MHEKINEPPCVEVEMAMSDGRWEPLKNELMGLFIGGQRRQNCRYIPCSNNKCKFIGFGLPSASSPTVSEVIICLAFLPCSDAIVIQDYVGQENERHSTIVV